MNRALSYRLTTLFALSVSAAAQTFVVDAAGGPGSSFRNLQTAIQSVPDGAILRVRPGTYQAFTIRSKGLTILGDGAGVVVEMPADVVVEDTNAAHGVLLSGFTLAPLPSHLASRLLLRRTAGAVTLHDIDMELAVASGSFAGITMDACAKVQVDSCTFESRTPFATYNPAVIDVIASYVHLTSSTIRGPTTGGIFASTAALRLSESNAVLSSTQVIGGKGNDPFPLVFCAPSFGGRGGPGIVMHQASFLTVLGGAPMRIQGGGGGNYIGGTCTYAGDGGNGMELSGGSIARLEGIAPLAGAGGCCFPTGNGTPGQPYVLSGGSVLTSSSRTPAVLSLRGPVSPGSTVSLHLRSGAGATVFLLVGLRTDYIPLAPTAIGALLVRPEPHFVLGPFASPVGSFTYPVALGPAWPHDLPVHFQYAAIDVQQTLWLSNTALIALGS